MEQPTGFKSGAYYSREAHRRLVADGVLVDGECADPDDLSVLADVLYDKYESQTALTSRLPKEGWRTAAPNSGHLIAAALLIEGALRHVITLNYDLAFQHAVTALGNSTNITFVEGPDEHSDLSSHSVVHLHRSVNKPEDTWVLRKTALDTDWASAWESVIAAANLSAPVVVFVGLGSPASVLTESVSNLAAKAQSSYYLVDRNPESKFRDALSSDLTGTVDLYWGEFMTKLAQRVAVEQLQRLRDAYEQMVREDPEMRLPGLEDIATPIQEISLLSLGRARATWLLGSHPYAAEGDASRQRQIAHLLLATARMSIAFSASSFDLDEYGRLTLTGGSGSNLVFGVAHGGGTSAWSAISAKIRERNEKLAPQQRTTLVVVAGARNTHQPKVDDLVRDDISEDLIRGADSIKPIFADDYFGRPEADMRSAVEELRR
ncbi:hypothetical protein [Rhodococcus sp. 077-4]|uniref:hypothetical protein n=1 Tax=Rhodococcus sp. 077-4 TaxID=2789271 RepID=UPI0039F4D8DD